jgi:hypothetical protein
MAASRIKDPFSALLVPTAPAAFFFETVISSGQYDNYGFSRACQVRCVGLTCAMR